MKKITTYLLQIAAVVMLCTVAASCRPEDLFDDDEGTLPPGSHPISFVASVGSMETRSDGKNSWEEDDRIGVRTINLKGRKYSMLGCYSLNEEGMMKDIVKRYTVGADGAWNELDEEPLEWPYPNGKVQAWYPFEPQVDVPIGNQAERGFDHLDFLSVTTDEKSYKEVVDLKFRHRMAKVTCRVIPDDGITTEEFKTLWLKMQGHTSCTFKETELTGSDNIGWITPDSTYNEAGSLYEALLVPNEMAGKDLISIGLQTNYEGHIIPKHFTYPSPKIEEGMHYIYNITVKKDRIEVSFLTVEWNDEREGQHEPTKFTFRVNLSEELVKLMNYSSNGKNEINTNLFNLSDNVTPILNEETGFYDKFDVVGNEFTISIGASKETRSKKLVLIKNEAINNPQVINRPGVVQSRTYVENKVFMISDETTLGYEDVLNVGDYFFSDGSWSSVLGWDDVHCIGIVFAVNGGDDLSEFKLSGTGGEYVADTADNYDYTDNKGKVNPIYTSQRIRGYVLALEDARRLDYVSVAKTLKKDDVYSAGTLEYDTQVDVAATTLKYSSGTEYPGGTLPYDVKLVIGSDTTVYKKGTVYSDGRLTRSVTVVVEAQTSVYEKGTSYPGGKLITDMTVTSLNVPKTVWEFPWGALTSGSAWYGAICSLNRDDFYGFANMVSVKRNEGRILGHTSNPVPPFNKLEAFAAAEGYEGYFKAPESTSGWYLPSIKQLQVALGYIYTFDSHLPDSPIEKAKGKTPSGLYWSSTIAYLAGNNAPGNKACYFSYIDNSASAVEIVASQKRQVRAVLTF